MIEVAGEIPPPEVVEMAVKHAVMSPCQKSKRGSVIWSVDAKGAIVILGAGYNELVVGQCDGSAACRRDCAKICVHSEQTAVLVSMAAVRDPAPKDLLHIKVVDGEPVAGGPPSCAECSKLILFTAIRFVWLLEEERGWVSRPSVEFHRATLRQRDLYLGPG